MSRPLSSPLPRTQIVNLRLNEREHACLEGYANRYQRTVSDVIRDALEILSITPDNPLRK